MLPAVFLLVLSGCATPQVPEVHFLWQGKPGEALRYFGSADAAQAALDQAIAACNFDIRQTAAGEIADETGLNKACMAARGWLPDR
jgi:hypothetical protein